MASMKFSLVLLLACVLSLPGVLADIICENLPANVCAFAVSSSGKRCVLENSIMDGKVEYLCKTSEVVVGSSTVEYLETDECLNACGLHWKTLGMSSDALLEPGFTAKLCSPACYNSCPNIVDLYFNLAAGEGVYLPYLCEKKRTPRRAMVQISSSGAAASAPTQRRSMVELLNSGAAAPVADVPTQRRAMVELLSSDAAAPAADVATQRRAMVELLSSGAAAPDTAPAVDAPRRSMMELLSSSDTAAAPAADAPIQLRAMTELLSSGEPSLIPNDDFVVDTPVPSPL